MFFFIIFNSKQPASDLPSLLRALAREEQTTASMSNKERHVTTSLRTYKFFQRKRSANNHNDQRQHQLSQVQINNGSAGLVSKEHGMHDGGERECGQHIREVPDQPHHGAEPRE